jgi:rod shape determining protein RodA
MLSMRKNSIKVYIIIIPIVFLIIISLMALYSVSLHQNVQLYSSSFFKQLIFLIFGIIAMIVMFNIPIKLYHKHSIILYILAIIAIKIDGYILARSVFNHQNMLNGFLSFFLQDIYRIEI